MVFADSNRASLRYLKEASWAVTPGSGKTREMRITSSALAATKETAVSDELRADRMVSDVIETAAMSGGDINFEYSFASHDDLLEAFVLGAWSRPMSGDQFRGIQIGWTDTDDLTIVGADYRDYFDVGRRIKTEGFFNPVNNGYYEIASLAFTGGNTVVTVTTTTSVAEAGTAAARLFDANDVIILNNTDIDAVANGFDGGGTNPFAAAIAAGQLRIGQKIFVDGIGYGAGSVEFTGVTNANKTITINDGVNSLAFVFSPTGLAVGANVTASATALVGAINAARINGVGGVKLNVRATNAAGVVNIINLNKAGGSIVETADPGNEATVVNFAGGSATASGYFTITSLGDDDIGVTPNPGALTANRPVTIKGSMLRNPGVVSQIIPQSFSIETGFNDITQFLLHKGLRIGSFNLEIAAGAIVTGTAATQGRDTGKHVATVLGNAGTYDVLSTTSTAVMNATSNVGLIEKNGAPLSTAVQSISLTMESNLRNQMAVSSKFPRGIGTGRFNLTGTLTAYFETMELWNHCIEHDVVSLGFRFEDVDGNAAYWTLPAVHFQSDPVAPAGIDQDIMETIEFTAKRDPVTACMLQVDRFSSVKPV